MGSAPLATLGGVPLLGSKEVAWRMIADVEPPLQKFEVAPKDLARLIAQGGFGNSVSLVITDGGNPNTFEGLHIIREFPAQNPNIAAVEVTDRRWLWKTKHVLKRYNMRRRVGNRRRRGDWAGKLQAARLDPRFQYAFYSLDKGKRWTAKRVLIDIMTSQNALGEVEPEDPIFEPEFDELEELPVEDLVLDESGEAALRRVLALVPGAAVTIDPTGRTRFYSRISGKDTGLVDQAGHEIVQGGHIEFVSNGLTRPRHIDFFFTIEAELRFDFLGDDFSRQTVDENDPPRFVDNVVQLPDFNGIDNRGTHFSQGTWTPVIDCIEGWGTPPGFSGRLTLQKLNEAFVPGNNLFMALGMAGQRVLSPSSNDSNWSARVAALTQHYRQTFRISREWVDRVLHFKPYLVATLDEVSGQRSPALVFADHAIRPMYKSRLALAQKSGQEGDHFAYNVTGYPGEDEEIGSKNEVSPASLQVVDSDQGIVRIQWVLDPFERSMHVLPAKLENSVDPDKGGPRDSLRKSNASHPIGFNIRGQNLSIPQLATEHRAAILLTAVPAAPNSKRQLYRVRVTPKDIEDLVPKVARESLSFAEGPPREVRIGAGMETARVRWTDADSDRIKRIFLDVDGDNSEQSIGDLVVNESENRVASLRAIAHAAAASIYAQEHDRHLGRMTGRMDSQLLLDGAASEIQHILDEEGRAHTVIGLPPSLPALSMFSFMDPGTRQIVLKQVQPFE